MTDMIVNLRNLPDIHEDLINMKNQQILFRQPIAPELDLVVDWVHSEFGKGWANEVAVSFSNQPVSCWIAQKENAILGFACYESTSRNYFGPTGVLQAARKLGIGRLLLVCSLESLKALGYAYAVIGGVGPVEYYERTVGAKIIEGSDDGIYHNMLRRNIDE